MKKIFLTVPVIIGSLLFLSTVLLSGLLIYFRNDEVKNQAYSAYIAFIEEHFQANSDVTYDTQLIALSPDEHFSFDMSREIYQTITVFNDYTQNDIFAVYCK